MEGLIFGILQYSANTCSLHKIQQNLLVGESPCQLQAGLQIIPLCPLPICYFTFYHRLVTQVNLVILVTQVSLVTQVTLLTKATQVTPVTQVTLLTQVTQFTLVTEVTLVTLVVQVTLVTLIALATQVALVTLVTLVT